MRFYGEDLDELHLAFNFVFLLADFEAAQLAPIVAETEALLPEHAWPVWTLGNHDMVRFPTRWARGDRGLVALRAHAAADAARDAGPLLRRRARACPTPRSRPSAIVDPVGLLNDPERPGPRRRALADAVERRAGRGLQRARRRALAALRRARRGQRRRAAGRPGSALHLTRDLIALRRAEEDLRTGAYEQVAVDDGLWAYRRGDGLPGGAQPRRRRRERAGRRHDRDRHAPPARRRGDRAVAAAGARRGRRAAPGLERGGSRPPSAGAVVLVRARGKAVAAGRPAGGRCRERRRRCAVGTRAGVAPSAVGGHAARSGRRTRGGRRCTTVRATKRSTRRRRGRRAPLGGGAAQGGRPATPLSSLACPRRRSRIVAGAGLSRRDRRPRARERRRQVALAVAGWPMPRPREERAGESRRGAEVDEEHAGGALRRCCRKAPRRTAYGAARARLAGCRPYGALRHPHGRRRLPRPQRGDPRRRARRGQPPRTSDRRLPLRLGRRARGQHRRAHCRRTPRASCTAAARSSGRRAPTPTRATATAPRSCARRSSGRASTP